MSEEIVLQGFGGKLAAKRWTQGKSPLLALHGWLDNAGSFDGLAPLLDGYDLVCLDLPGHGFSYHRPPGVPYHFVDWVPEVFQAAESLGWEKFHLLGHSMGAAIATLAAGTFPEKIHKLVLLEGIGPFSSPDEEAPALLQKALLYKPSQGRRYYPDREDAIKRLMRRELEEHSARALAERALAGDESGWYFTYATEARGPSRQRPTENQVLAYLKRISCPTLFVYASDGLKLPEPYAQRHRFIADLTKVEVEGRHHAHLDHPQRVAPLIKEFLVG
ncbi:MAG: alpha/beta hydrolase [Vulcanimicrobiota bacterium]